MEKKENYFNSPEFQETLRRYEASLQEGRSEYFGSDELSDISEYYYDCGKKKEAVDVLDYAIQLHPGAAMPLVFKGRIALIDNKDIDTAQHYADMVADQLDLDYLYLQAEIMITRGNIAEADSFLSNAMHQIDEDDVPDYVLDIATIFIDYNQPDIAAKWLALSDEDDLLDYREVKARIAFAKGDYEQSEQIFEQLLDEDPYSGKYWNSLAVTQLMSNRINDSITSSEYSIAIDPEDEEALLNKANALFSLGNFTDAMDYYQRFLKLCPDEGAAYMFLGNCLLNLGRPEEAMPQYNKALECYEKCNLSTAEVNQCRAFTLSLLGHVEQALECLNETLKDPDCNRMKSFDDGPIAQDDFSLKYSEELIKPRNKLAHAKLVYGECHQKLRPIKNRKSLSCGRRCENCSSEYDVKKCESLRSIIYKYYKLFQSAEETTNKIAPL